jgi:hypothetical protein
VIRLKFSFPQPDAKHLQVFGHIVRITPNGIGINFKELTKEQKAILGSYCGDI